MHVGLQSDVVDLLFIDTVGHAHGDAPVSGFVAKTGAAQQIGGVVVDIKLVDKDFPAEDLPLCLPSTTLPTMWRAAAERKEREKRKRKSRRRMEQ